MTSELPKASKLHRYREQAMASHIEVILRHPDKTLADSVAGMLFREIDRLEDLLSRFRDGSDIVRINQLQEGETVFISPECHTCLLQGMEVQMLTQGKFDIAAGGFMELLRDLNGGPVVASEADWELARERRRIGSIQLDPTEARVSCVKPGLQLDLGGIGKGIVLECLAEILAEHEISDYLLSAGGSTLLARGAESESKAWTTCLSGKAHALDVELRDGCIAGSGFEVQGAHIISEGRRIDVAPYRRTWVMAPNAALADALSTACFLMNAIEIQELNASLSGAIQVWVEAHDGSITQILG